MKKINYILMALVSVLAFTWTACDDDIEYTPAGSEGVDGVYFPAQQPSDFTLQSDGSSFDVLVNRGNSDAAVSVDLLVEADSATLAVLTFPESVSFGAGVSQTAITVTYDPARLEYDKEMAFTIKLVGDVAYYGNIEFNGVAVFPAPWESLGMGSYDDNFFFEETYEVEIQQNKENPSQFRLVYPYHEGLEAEGYGGATANTGEYLILELLAVGEDLAGVTITQEDLVYFADYNTGWNNPSYNDDVKLYHPAVFKSLCSEDMWLHSKVLSYQENGLPAQIQLAPMYYMDDNGGWNYTQEDGLVIITFPGVVIADYSIEVAYTGRYVSPGDSIHEAFANVILGADVAKAEVATLKTKDANEVLSAMLNDVVETQELTESGQVRLPLGEDGIYTIVAISYDAEGVPQEYAYTSFEFVRGASPWESLGMATITDGAVAPTFGLETPVYQAEVLHNTADPGIYRVMHPYGEAYPYYSYGEYDSSQDYYLEINAQDPEGCYFDVSPLGLTLTSDGMIGLYSVASYYMANGYDLETLKAAGGYCGVFKDNVITFPVSPEINSENMQHPGSVFLCFPQNSNSLYVVPGDLVIALPGADVSTQSLDIKSAQKQTLCFKGKKINKKQAKMAFVSNIVK